MLSLFKKLSNFTKGVRSQKFKKILIQNMSKIVKDVLSQICKRLKSFKQKLLKITKGIR